MMNPARALPAIFALLVGAIGWYYLFYSQAVTRLGGIEENRTNRVRGMLRRINAIVMLLIALGIALIVYKFDNDQSRAKGAVTLLAVLFLSLMMIILGLIDVRLTWKLRRALRDRNRPS
jgi:hypothetical protein